MKKKSTSRWLSRLRKGLLGVFIWLTGIHQHAYASDPVPASRHHILPAGDTALARNPVNKSPEEVYKAALARLKTQADELRKYASLHQFNTDYCFLVDMSLHSGKNRFFVYNLKNESIEEATLVSHGIGSNIAGSDIDLKFSNSPASLQTSLGRYKVGNSYKGQFGLSYKLFGLDETNDNAYKRAIVIHAHKEIPNNETYPLRIGESFGCPMVSPEFLELLGNKYIKQARKPILLWIYQ